MSTLEWRREQPRVEPPRRFDWPLAGLMLADSLIYATVFTSTGDIQDLMICLVCGVLAHRIP